MSNAVADLSMLTGVTRKLSGASVSMNFLHTSKFILSLRVTCEFMCAHGVLRFNQVDIGLDLVTTRRVGLYAIFAIEACAVLTHI